MMDKLTTITCIVSHDDRFAVWIMTALQVRSYYSEGEPRKIFIGHKENDGAQVMR